MDDSLEFAGELVERSPIVVNCVFKAMAAEEYEDLDKRIEVEAEGSARVPSILVSGAS